MLSFEPASTKIDVASSFARNMLSAMKGKVRSINYIVTDEQQVIMKLRITADKTAEDAKYISAENLKSFEIGEMSDIMSLILYG